MTNPETNANDQASAPTNVPTSNARAQFETERMTRRAALRKFGIGAGMAALLALSTDDLARMAAVKLKQHAGDNKVANQVADEFKNAGVAFADSSGCGDCGGLCFNTVTVKCIKCQWGCPGYYPTERACYDNSHADCLSCCKQKNPGDASGEADCAVFCNLTP